jgi:hypothetical protein
MRLQRPADKCCFVHYPPRRHTITERSIE